MKVIFMWFPMPVILSSHMKSYFMKNYSSAKLKLLAKVKWSVCKKFKDYLIG